MEKKFKIQLCHFQRDKGSPWEKGVAWLNVDFNHYNISIIIDASGDQVIKPYNYMLFAGDRCYIDSHVDKHMEHRVWALKFKT